MGRSRAPICQRPIFIHAMWRSASTYFWKKFRDQPCYRAYYEPLHEILVKPREQVLSSGDERRAASLRHPPIEGSYFTEFPFVRDDGVAHFEKPLSYERYCLQEDEKDSALHQYVGTLIRHAVRHEQRAVLQFNRGLLRCGWLTRNFKPVNILILRRPASVWKSFLSFKGNSFVGVFCIVLGQNKSKWPLKFLPDWLDLPCRIGSTIEDDYAAYAPIAAELASRMYPAFFDFFLASTLHCARYADCILDVDELSENPASRAAAERRLRHFGIKMDFSDCLAPSYALGSTREREWLAYEDFARVFLGANLPVDMLLHQKTYGTHAPLLSNYFRELLGEFVAQAPRRRPAPPAHAAIKHAEGLNLFRASRHEAAAATLGAALAVEPTSERWNDWATAQASCSRSMLAELGYRQALKMDPWNGEAAANLGAVLAVFGRNSEALPLLEKAQRAGPSERGREISNLLGRVRHSIGMAAMEHGNYAALGPLPRLSPRRGLTVFFTGLSGAGKTSLASDLRLVLLAMGVPAITLLDGDAVRAHLSSHLGFSREHRGLNIRRIGFVAAEVSRHGGVAICAAIAPFDAARKHARAMVEASSVFVLVHLATPLATCEQRDPKGLYAKARAGSLPHFTGISDPYEEPRDAEIRIDTSVATLEESTHKVLLYLIDRQLIPHTDSVAPSSVAMA